MDYRQLGVDELGAIRDIDRTERVEELYVQHGTRLELRAGDWNASAWDADGSGEHSVAAQRTWLESAVGAGSIAVGAYEGDRLVGIGVVTRHVRPGVAQFAYLYVSNGYRGRGIGGRLSDELERIALEAGDTAMVVSATPSHNTVDFYRRRGYEPMAEPLPELLSLEPEDIHMAKSL